MWINWIIENKDILLLITNILLLIVTAIYVVLTGKMAMSSQKQLKISANPIIGINITKMNLSKREFNKRRVFTISLDIYNMGNAPAVDVQIDGELVYQYTDIDGNKEMPAYTSPRRIPFIKQNESINDNFETNIYFESNAISPMIQDIEECDRLNLNRIENNTDEEVFVGPKLHIFVYYSNNLGQQFESSYETYICKGFKMINDECGIPIRPIDIKNDAIDMEFHPYIRPIFKSKLVKESTVASILKNRDSKRHLCRKYEM